MVNSIICNSSEYVSCLVAPSDHCTVGYVPFSMAKDTVYAESDQAGDPIEILHNDKLSTPEVISVHFY